MVFAAVQGVAANTVEWYRDHPDQAKAMLDACKKRLKANEQLSQSEMDECRRAGDAVFTGGQVREKDSGADLVMP